MPRPSDAFRFALIVADPTAEQGRSTSYHRTREAAEAAKDQLDIALWRYAYVSERKPDGSWPLDHEPAT
jgi:hypothetical protein